MTGTYTIRGVLTLRSATHQTAEGGTTNLSKTFMQYIQYEGVHVPIPYISGTSVRGLLRRAAAERIWDSIRRRLADGGRTEDLQVIRETFQSVARGSFGRNAIKPGDATLAEIVDARKHVFAGLFGGGMLMHPSKLALDSELRPLVEETKHLFPAAFSSYCVSSGLGRRSAAKEKDAKSETPAEANEQGSIFSTLVSEVMLAPRDDFESGGGIGVIENHLEAMVEYQTQNRASSAAKKVERAQLAAAKKADPGQRHVIADEERVRMSTTKNFLKVQVINPGTRLYFGVVLTNVSEAQLGLALMAIQDWANENALGGGSARGFGRFNITLALEDANGVIADSLLIGDSPFYALSANALVQTAVRRAAEEIELIDRANLEKVYPIDMKPGDADLKAA